MLRSHSLNCRVLFQFMLALTLVLVSQNVWARDWWQVEIGHNKIEAEISRTGEEQLMGLGNRFSLPEGQGMLFLYKNQGEKIFWMKRMNFPIDILWLNNGKLVLIEKDVPPPKEGTPDAALEKYGFGVLADMVLELPGGYTQKHHIQLGDSLRILKKE